MKKYLVLVVLILMVFLPTVSANEGNKGFTTDTVQTTFSLPSFVSQIVVGAQNSEKCVVRAWGLLFSDEKPGSEKVFWIEVLHEGQVGIIFSQPLTSYQRSRLKKANRENAQSSWRARSPWDYFILKPGQRPKDESNIWMFPLKNPCSKPVGVLLMYRSFSVFDRDYGQVHWVVEGLEEYLGVSVALEQSFE